MAQVTAREFWRLPKAGRAVLVAKDILKWIKVGKILSTKGYYIYTSLSVEEREIPLKGNIEKIPACSVCELGACTLAIGNLGNNLTLNEVSDVGDWYSTEPLTKAQKLLMKVFSKQDIKMIEACFEGNEGHVAKQKLRIRTSPEELKIARKYARVFRGQTKRMKAISRNIIRNKGKFIPEQDVKVIWQR